MSHSILLNCLDAKLKCELEQSKNYFETTIDKPIYAFLATLMDILINER